MLLMAALLPVAGGGCASHAPPNPPVSAATLRIVHDDAAGTVSVFRREGATPILKATASADGRPYVHPIAAPDGKGVLTEYSPSHHKHQTGLYWGFTRVNGRDFFHNPGRDYWQRVSLTVLEAGVGEQVRWQTVYNLLDASAWHDAHRNRSAGRCARRRHVRLDLEWRGDAHTDVTIGQYDYGGLFLRMPWRQGMRAEVVNAARQRDARAEGQRAMWIDVGVQVDGRTICAHVALFDHPDNVGYPQAWRVDGRVRRRARRARDCRLDRSRKATPRSSGTGCVAYTGTL